MNGKRFHKIDSISFIQFVSKFIEFRGTSHSTCHLRLEKHPGLRTPLIPSRDTPSRRDQSSARHTYILDVRFLPSPCRLSFS